MLTNDQLDEIVRELFYLGVEGEYWDFKEKPYFFEGQSKEEKNKKIIVSPMALTNLKETAENICNP